MWERKKVGVTLTLLTLEDRLDRGKYVRRCVAARMLQNLKLRRGAGPFDWLLDIFFSSKSLQKSSLLA